MSNCPAVDIANQFVSDLNTAVGNSYFSQTFTARAVMGHAARKLDASDFTTAKVDIVPPPAPDLEVLARGSFKYGHQLDFMVGLRKSLSSSEMNADGSFNLTATAPWLNLYYELLMYLLPSGANPQGTRITVTPWVAVVVPPFVHNLVLWDPDMLSKKLYCGVFMVRLQIIEESPQS